MLSSVRCGDLSRIGSQPHLQVVICSVVPIIVYGLAGNQKCGHSFKSGFSQFSNPMEVSIFLAAIFLSNRAGGVKFQDTLIPIDFRKANGICTIPQSPWLYGWYVYHPSQSLAVLFPSHGMIPIHWFLPKDLALLCWCQTLLLQVPETLGKRQFLEHRCESLDVILAMFNTHYPLVN